MGWMGYDTVHGWVRFSALLLIFTMGILNIVLPHKLLEKNFLPWFLEKRFKGRQDQAAVWTVRGIGIFMVLLSITCVAYFVWRYNS